MLKSNETLCEVDSPKSLRLSAFPVKVFTTFSKTELLAVLQVMHRILDADRRSDLDALLRELPALLGRSGPLPPREDGGFFADAPPSGGGQHLLKYFVSCLSKAQTRIPCRPSGLLRTATSWGPLTKRELSVLRWMKEGKTNWEIARILGLSERTIRFHIGSIFEKLDVNTRTQAVARALGAGLIAS